MTQTTPRVVVAALRGGSGKTTLSLGLIAAWRNRAGGVVPFKKGPDYIDAGWLSLAAGRPCYNLDPFMMAADDIIASFCSRTRGAAGAVIEGNRGLFDGLDREGSCSTAELAKLLKAPVLLVVDGTKVTRSAAAIVLGCLHLDAQVSIGGVILNRVAGSRHESMLRASIEHYCGIPVLGAVPRFEEDCFPERHMGLVTVSEHPEAARALLARVQAVERYLDLEKVIELASKVRGLECDLHRLQEVAPSTTALRPPRIGVVRDSAFQFYYPENLEALEERGAELVECSALTDSKLPPVDALYIGGGFPETHAQELATNEGFRQSLRMAIDQGLPVYAECGGLMYLGRSIRVQGRTYPMVGALPLDFELCQRPQAHGYTRIEVVEPNPFYPVGTRLRGHEFHYSRITAASTEGLQMAFRMGRGRGIVDERDGVCYRNVLATYSHVHASGTPLWAEGMIQRALATVRTGGKGQLAEFETTNLDCRGQTDAGLEVPKYQFRR